MQTTTLEFTPIPATVMPTQSVPILTPDAIQVERWQEYQMELAKVVLSSDPELRYDPAINKDALCEWDILGQSGQEVYVYAVCVIAKGNGSMRTPAIIYLETDGTIREVKLPEPEEEDRYRFNYNPFPKDVQEKFCFYFDPFPSDLPPCPNRSSMFSSPRLDVLYAHLEYRKTHLDEPPLVVLSVAQTATLEPTPIPATVMPTQSIPILTPDAIQVERWQEYQTELAKVVLYGYGPDAYKDALCEWDILGRSGQEVYVWAYCSPQVGGGSGIRPAVINLEMDGSIRDVKIAGYEGPYFDLDLFPADVQEKLDMYYLNVCVYCGRPEILRLHILYRLEHPDELPLIVLSELATATPAP